MKQELYYCKGCEKDKWLTSEDFRVKGPLCPNGCLRNKLVYLGETEEEIASRRKEFKDTNGFDFEVNIIVNEDEEDDTLRLRRKPIGNRDKDDLPW